ncbi:hypothetical protein FACS1894181_15990 [Bacteroidia bacterium]|nr:hypothetical protein FACS1894181_15990 [Bacteroidia bacterium]
MNFNLKTSMMAAFIAAMGFTSCVEEEVIPQGQEVSQKDKSVRLTISTNVPSTRSEETPANAQPVDFKGGWLFFTSAQGNITKVMAITNSASGATSVDINDLTQQDGAEIKDVPSHSVKAHVIGNLPNGKTTPTVGADISTIMNNVITVQEQGNITELTLFGEGNIIPSQAHANQMEAKLILTPIAARIEVGKMTETGGVITSYQVDGIFINNYYPDALLSGTVNTTEKKLGEQNADANFAGGSTEYPSALEGILYDYNASGIGTAPATGKVWAYNLMAPTSPSGSLSAPHIVVRISNITTNNGASYTGTWYLTITGLLDGGKAISHLKPAHIYQIKDLKFSHSNLQPKPEMEPMDVWVEVNLVQWTTVDTGYIFGQL